MTFWDGFKQQPWLAMAGKRNPWGKSGGDDGGDGAGGEPEAAPEPPKADKPDKTPAKGPRNPWLPPGGGSRGEPPRRSASIEDIFKTRGPEGPRRVGGPGGPSFSLPPRANGKSWWPLIAAGVVGVWLVVTSAHQVQPKQGALVTWLGGKYSHNLGPGLNFTFPWPIQQVTKENVSEIRSVKIGGTEGEKLVLTGDQNLVDLSYVIRWNIKNLQQFTFQLDDPELTIREVAESAMRAAMAEQDLDQVVSGAGRAAIEARVVSRMQQLLDAYEAGVAVQGLEIVKADPPAKVIDAFKDVSAAQQDANAMRNRARAYAQQVMARAQGDAAAFDQIYAEYKLAPEVTRRRLYYETMESVLGKTDKTIIGSDGVVPYLPLPEVNKRAATPPAVSVEGR